MATLRCSQSASSRGWRYGGCRPWLIPFAFGPAFADVALLLGVLAICVPLRFLSTSVGSALLTEGHMRYRVFAMLAATIVAVVLTFVLIPRSGGIGAAWATVAAEATLLLLMYLGVRRMPRPAREVTP